MSVLDLRENKDLIEKLYELAVKVGWQDLQDQIDVRILTKAILSSSGSRMKAAKVLGMNRTTLTERLRKYGMVTLRPRNKRLDSYARRS